MAHTIAAVLTHGGSHGSSIDTLHEQNHATLDEYEFEMNKYRLLHKQ